VDSEKLWEAYAKTKSPEIKEQIIERYAPLVKYVAGRLAMQVGQYVEFDDLVGYGVFGLLDAIDKFDFVKGVKFETYASLRIRGSIIDNIRKMDWVPRALRQKNKRLETSYAELEAELGREPEDAELAAKLGVTVGEARDVMKKSSVLSLISLDDYLENNHEAESLSDDVGTRPDAAYDRAELRELLASAIDGLKENEKKVVALYYFHELTLKEISAIMGVSESRVSQIHGKALLKLNARLGKHKSVLLGG
jgi:RNA polymerase sigma factor for flagellar operon FliA